MANISSLTKVLYVGLFCFVLGGWAVSAMAQEQSAAQESTEARQPILDQQIRQTWSRLNQVAMTSGTNSEEYLRPLQVLINLFMDADMLPLAEPLIQQGLDALTLLKGPNHYMTLKMRILMSKVDYSKGRYERVSGELNNVLIINKSKGVLSREQIKEAELYLYRARLGLVKELIATPGKQTRAEQLLLVLIPDFESLLGTKAPEFLEAVHLRAEGMLMRRHYGDAEALFQYLLELYNKLDAPPVDERVRVYRDLAILYGEQRQMDKALIWIDKAYHDLPGVIGVRTWQTKVEVLSTLIVIYQSLGKTTEIMPLVQKMESFIGNSLGHHSLKHARFSKGLAEVLSFLKMDEQAKQLTAQSEQMGQQIFKREPKLFAHWWESLAQEKPSGKRRGNDLSLLVRYMDDLIARLFVQSESVMLWRTKYQEENPQWQPSSPSKSDEAEAEAEPPEPEQKSSVVQKIKEMLTITKDDNKEQKSAQPAQDKSSEEASVGLDARSGYHVSMGCFSSKSFPSQIIRRGEQEGLNVYMRALPRGGGRELYCAVAGPFNNRLEAEQTNEAIKILKLSEDSAIVFYK
ncbi:hypothetical protein Mmc1_2241 [Magnetococcus marinus MC-1]|uniref:SPOR domain-containing protein n=1 Tax=Magnetococcus marinus (strain ATCC BAA-1437 / JCM 17883 / MC-1) TaxID=156889 RepID=A0L9U9_MAGMM|nr:hypothetical protein [Magnetococcus marinus]ABK44742.1 hypothetical protein Mmc1_2241 [Magnetococcus marinus MC-1]